MALRGSAVGRQPTGFARPAFDAAPSPDGRTSKCPNWLREARSGGEPINTLRRETEPPSDVSTDHQLRTGVNPHVRTISNCYWAKPTLKRFDTRDLSVGDLSVSEFYKPAKRVREP